MTVVTGSFEMFAVEFVFGIPVMVEYRLVPAFLLVTGFAVIAESLGMNIPDRVAVHTPLGSIFVFALEMTGVTGHLLV
jgi:hypothetical protein